MVAEEKEELGGAEEGGSNVNYETGAPAKVSLFLKSTPAREAFQVAGYAYLGPAAASKL